MTEQNINRNIENGNLISDWAAYTVGTVLLRIASLFFVPLVFILPMPAIILYSKRGLKPAITSILASLAVLIFVIKDYELYSLQIILVGGIAGIMAANLLKAKVTMNKVAIVLILLPMFFLPVMMIAYNLIMPQTLQTSIKSSAELLEKSVEEMQQTRNTGEKEKAQMEDLVSNVKWFIVNLYPSIFASSTVIAVLLSLQLVKKYANNLMGFKLESYKFSEINLPENFLLFFVVSGLGVLLLAEMIGFASSNLLAYTFFFYFIVGLAVLSYAFNIFGVTTGVRILFYVALLLLPFMPIALSVIGMFDARVPVREKIRKFKEKISENIE